MKIWPLTDSVISHCFIFQGIKYGNCNYEGEIIKTFPSITSESVCQVWPLTQLLCIQFFNSEYWENKIRFILSWCSHLTFGSWHATTPPTAITTSTKSRPKFASCWPMTRGPVTWFWSTRTQTSKTASYFPQPTISDFNVTSWMFAEKLSNIQRP